MSSVHVAYHKLLYIAHRLARVATAPIIKTQLSALLDSLAVSLAAKSHGKQSQSLSASPPDLVGLDVATLPAATPCSSSPPTTPITPLSFSPGKQTSLFQLSPLSPIRSSITRGFLMQPPPPVHTEIHHPTPLPVTVQDEGFKRQSKTGKSSQAAEEQIKRVREAVIGEGVLFDGPFGKRRITYTDYTASGRSLAFIENYIRQLVLPFYANTHTEASYTGRQTSRFRSDARAIIHQAVGGSEEDVVLFGGSGSTWGINRMVDVLCLKDPRVQGYQRPVVFIGPYEHHSNILPWRESNVDVIGIGQTVLGQIDQEDLRARLAEYQDRSLKIGSFSAASNVTGILSDVDGVTTLLHRHDALAFWDYAAAAPYIDINMNPDGVAGGPRSKDAVFIPPHKFVGGPGTPGILVVKRRLFSQSRTPSAPGGGTVSFVTKQQHLYDADIEHREEGGTPDIIGCVRAGLVFQLKQSIGAVDIEKRERAFGQAAIAHWKRHPSIVLLGDTDVPRLSILSFLIRHQNMVLHHDFVVVLLNDLFGIQARGGCSCAGPYGSEVLHIDEPLLDQLANAVVAGHAGIKPGWTRINFNYFISATTFRFILQAVDFVATRGHVFLRQYRFDNKTGLWEHRNSRPVQGLGNSLVRHLSSPGGGHVGEKVFTKYLERARELAILAEKAAGEEFIPALPAEVEELRWFALP